jgi:hypothetical protein
MYKVVVTGFKIKITPRGKFSKGMLKWGLTVPLASCCGV